MTYKELRNQTGEPGQHPFLTCRECGGEWSANAGDYFWALSRVGGWDRRRPALAARPRRCAAGGNAGDYFWASLRDEVACPECALPMILALKRVRIIEVAS